MRSRRSRLSLGVTAALALAVAACSDSSTEPLRAPGVAARPNVNFAQTGAMVGGWIVQLKTYGAMQTVINRLVADGGTIGRTYPQIGLIEVSGLTNVQMNALKTTMLNEVKSFTHDRELQWVPNAAETFAMADASDVLTGDGTNQSAAAFFNLYQWNMKVVQAPQAWAASPGGAGRTVCVLDSGVDPGHLDLIGKVTTAVSMSTDASFAGNQTPFDYNLHGTFVSSQISTRGIGLASVAPDVKLCSIKVLGVSGSGSFTDVIAGIMYAATTVKPDVINMSLGAYFDLRSGGTSLVAGLQAAVDYAMSQGITVVASSGNNGVNLDTDHPDILSVPAQIKGVISVGATGPVNQTGFDALASYSAFGGVSGIALVAPGGSGNPVVSQDLVLGACSRYNVSFNCTAGNNYLFGNGTSFASPVVAGAAAVVRSKFPGNLVPKTIRRCLTSTADVVGPSAIFGAGRLNVFKALSCAA